MASTFVCVGCCTASAGDGRGQGFRIDIEGHDVIASSGQPSGHGTTHIPQADKANAFCHSETSIVNPAFDQLTTWCPQDKSCWTFVQSPILTRFGPPATWWQTGTVSDKESRTTKKARAVLPDAQITVAIPAEALHVDGDSVESPAKRWTSALFDRRLGARPNPAAKVLAFTTSGVAVMGTKDTQAGIPETLLAQTSSFPSVLDNNDDGLVIALGDATYRVSRIHQDTMLSAISASALAAEVAAEPDEAASSLRVVEMPDAEPSPVDDAVDPAAARVVEVEEQEAVDAEEESAVEGEAEEDGQAGAAEKSVKARLGASASGWSDAFERFLFDDDVDSPPVEIETRSRSTIQCQRLLARSHGNPHVFLAVPGVAIPREGTDDPKGDFLIAITDDGAMLFKPSRGNKALPRDIIGPIDADPLKFEPADYSAREGGVLVVGGRRYTVTRPYVRSIVAHLKEHHG